MQFVPTAYPGLSQDARRQQSCCGCVSTRSRRLPIDRWVNPRARRDLHKRSYGWLYRARHGSYDYNLRMGKRRISQIAVLLLLAIFLLAPVYECFDHWDKFPRSGNDTVLNLIAAVTFCGVVLVAGRSLFRALTEKRLVKRERWNPPPVPFSFVACKTADESPPLSFRLSLRV